MIQSTKIKQLREKKGLSQEKLARNADVSNNTIVNLESGKQTNPTIETVSKIAKALDVAIEELLLK
jgi:DNA-binding XRE family transcriptional regulator